MKHSQRYGDDFIIAKNEKELETLIYTVRIYSQDIGMEFGMEKCAMLVMKSSKWHRTDGIELPNQDKIRTLGENDAYKYLGILEADTIKQVQMKDKIQKEYLMWTRKLLETKLSGRNLIKGINTWAVPLVRKSRPFLKWTKDEFKQMDQRTRKLMTMHKALHPRETICIKKRGGERTCQHQRHRWHERGLIIAIRKNTDITIDNRMTITRKNKWEEKQLYGPFKRLINNISHDKTWTWLRKGNFQREIESLLIAAQNNAIRTNHM